MSIYTVTRVGEEAVAAATRETILQLRGVTTCRAKVIAWGISFDGIVPTAEPVLVDFERQSTDGTATGATEYPLDEAEPASALITAFHTFTSTMPTSSAILEQYEVHPQGGLIIREYPPGREPVLDDSTSSRLAITVTAPAIVNVAAWLQWDE